MKPVILGFGIIWMLLPAFACDEARPREDPPYETDPALVSLHGVCPVEVRIGGFTVQSNDAQGYTVIDGTVRDGVAAGQWPRVRLQEGGCRLLAPRNPFCDPACSPGEYCDDTGETAICRTLPQGRDAGRVVLRGLARRLELGAIAPSYNYSYSQLEYPGFTPGQVVHLYTSGGFFGPFELYGVGVDSVGTQPDKVVISRGSDLRIAWAAGSFERAIRVFEISVDQHGLEPLTLSCSFADAPGEGVVPASVVDALLDAGVSGFPIGRMQVRTEDSAQLAAGCVDFVISSVRTLSVEVAGHTPCLNDGDCPPSQLCDESPDVQQCYTPCMSSDDCSPPQVCSARSRCE